MIVMTIVSIIVFNCVTMIIIIIIIITIIYGEAELGGAKLLGTRTPGILWTGHRIQGGATLRGF